MNKHSLEDVNDVYSTLEDNNFPDNHNYESKGPEDPEGEDYPCSNFPRRLDRIRRTNMYLDPYFKGQVYDDKILFQENETYNMSFSQYPIKRGLKEFVEEE